MATILPPRHGYLPLWLLFVCIRIALEMSLRLLQHIECVANLQWPDLRDIRLQLHSNLHQFESHEAGLLFKAVRSYTAKCTHLRHLDSSIQRRATLCCISYLRAAHISTCLVHVCHCICTFFERVENLSDGCLGGWSCRSNLRFNRNLSVDVDPMELLCCIERCFPVQLPSAIS